MKQEVYDAWISALKSEEYRGREIRGCLTYQEVIEDGEGGWSPCGKPSLCALGVLADVLVQHPEFRPGLQMKWELNSGGEDGLRVNDLFYNASFPDFVLEEIGLSYSAQEAIIDRFDTHGSLPDFEDIAAWLDAGLDKPEL